MVVPPPLLPQHSFTFGNGGQCVNMVVPPLPPAHHFRFVDGNQFANMDLQTQEDYVHHLQPRRLWLWRKTNIRQSVILGVLISFFYLEICSLV